MYRYENEILTKHHRITMSKKIILTGDRPTGKLHLGHYVGSLRQRVELQNSGLFEKIFIMVLISIVTGLTILLVSEIRLKR